MSGVATFHATGYLSYLDFPDLPWRPWTIGAAGMVVVVAVTRALLHRRENRRRFAGAKYVTIAAPPEVDLSGAVALWHHLAVIQRGRWRRFWCGQPYLIFEYAFTGPSLRIRLWVPGDISATMVTQAVAGAWPGATYSIADAEPPLSEGS
jgi:hypothetical protein